MTHDDTPMWEDPRESSALRQLLRAGRVENSDYDVDRGLARHLAQLQGGAPIPAWAVQTTLHKSAGWSVLAWILPPMISAAVVGAWLAIRPADPAALAVATPRTVSVQESVSIPATAPSEAAAPVVAAAPQELAVAVAAAPSEREVLDQRRDHHAVATTRSLRAAARTTSARRGRGSRTDDASFAAVSGGPSGTSALNAQGQGAGTSTASNVETSAVASANVAAVSSKAAPAEELAPKQEPAAEEPKAKDKEAKAKPERRGSKDEEGAQDEVTGARLEREMRMLAVAQRVLTDDPARSLRLCRQGESEFRGSMFSAERKQVALLALVQLGRVDQARREGIPFLRAFPNAPWSARLREALSSGRLPTP